ncbi:MAG: Gfo/Idh/MocA family oxidoreductase [Pirellulaceae bacterium]|nr:Gfo/Idh/MocA family oxidoreductase [Pirellulaceae bacterium]
MKLRIGLIGLGDAWQTRHRPALRMLEDRFDVRAVFSTISKLAENSAAEFQADPVDGYRELVARNDIDAVMILERSWLGWLPVIAACEAGKAIYWAGDLDFDPDQDCEVRERIEKSGVAFMAEFPRRFAPATLRLKELIATRLGPPRLIFCHRRLQIPDHSTARTDNAFNLVEQELVELVDWCRYVVHREPSQVACTVHPNNGSADYQCLSLQFDEQGELAPVTTQISCGNYIPQSWSEAANFRPPAAMQICCERGVAFIDLPATITWFDDAGRHLESLESESPVGEQLMTQFYRAVTSLVRNLGDLNDAYRAAQILAAARKSAADGRSIDI